jgi:nicotinamide-nucleotide amidase
MNCEIITIGDEILIGQITDTNSPWMAQQLNSIGISVIQMTSVMDTETSIVEALRAAFQRVELVLITGGLGPTNDDITKKTLTRFFQDELVLNTSVEMRLRKFFTGLNFPFRESDLQQAFLPSKAHILDNKIGTASGMWFAKEGKIAISLPGVPTEMKHLMLEGVLPKLRQDFKLPFISHKTIITYGMRESDMAIRLADFEAQLPVHIKLAYLPNYGKLRLRLTAKGNDKTQLENQITNQILLLESYLTDIVIGYEDFLLEAEIGNLLTQNHQTVSTAESFTGGNIAHMITMIPGASRYFVGSIVSYTAHLKESELGVSSDLIADKSVVSAEVAEAMALGIQKRFQTDFAIATTGNAGPTTDKTDKSVGEVYIGIASPKGVQSHYFNFGQPREKVIKRASSKALELLYKEQIRCQK